VDGPDLYRYCRGNPIIYQDPNGQEPPQPDSGVGFTFNARGVSFGAINTPRSDCDELNPACSSPQLPLLEFTSRFRPLPLSTPLPRVPSLPPGPFVFRGSDTDPLPTVNGLQARNPNATTPPVEHVLGDPNSPWISVTESPETARTFGNRVYGISVPEANTEYIPPTDLQAQMKAAIENGTVPTQQGEAWLKAQNNPHPASPPPNATVNPSDTPVMVPPEREGVMRGPIPPEAVVTAETLEGAARAANQAKWVSRINTGGRALGYAGIALSVAYVGYSAYRTIETGDPKPLVNAVVETAAGFAGAIGGAKLGAGIGLLVGGPIGAAIGGVVGGLIGAFAASSLAHAIMDWIW